jgi:multiple sugar transport system permease protein
MMMIFLAGLSEIPKHLYEAADIDGANSFQKLLRITIPMLTPAIFFNLVLDVINSFQVFTAALIATGGGPLNSTLFYVFHMYREAFSYLHIGYASALAVVLFIVVLVSTILLLRSERYWVNYGRM